MPTVKNITTGEEKEVDALNQDLADQGYVPFKANNINSTALTPTTEIPYESPDYSPVYPVNTLDTSTTQLQMTGPESEAQDLNAQLQALNNQLTGQTDYMAEMEKKYNIEELTKTQNDLSAQLKAVQNEAQAIPLQLQQEVTGKGVTVGGLRPIETARLRTNAIQALSVSSLLEASKGNLTTAMTLVDRAVAQKYNPIKEEIAAKQANLELILKSPAYTLAEKNRANAQLQAQEAQKQAIEQREALEKEIKGYAIEAAKNGADAITLQRIQNAQSPEEALQILTAFNNTLNKQALDDKMALGGYNYVKTPAERDSLKALGYDILVQGGRTYAKAPIVPAISVSGGGDSGRTRSSSSGSGEEEITPDLSQIPDDQLSPAESWAKLINDGKTKIENVPANMKNEVAQLIAGMPNKTDVKAQAAVQEKINSINELLASSGIKGSVGPNRFVRWSLSSKFTAAKQDFISGVKQIVSQETLDVLLQLKKGGGTLGALSDQERVMLQDAATKIGGWAIKDENGDITGYDTTEASFRKELEKIKRLANTAIINSNLDSEVMEDGTEWVQNPDGTFTQIN